LRQPSGGFPPLPTKLTFRYDRGTLREYFSFSWPLFISASAAWRWFRTIIVGNFSVGLAGVGLIGLAGELTLFADRWMPSSARRSTGGVRCARFAAISSYEAFVKSIGLGFLWAPLRHRPRLFAPDLVTYVLGERWRNAAGLRRRSA